MAAVRNNWVFRTAAVVYLFFGASFLWAATLRDYRPDMRPWQLGIGILLLAIGVFLFRRKKFAIGLSAAGAAIVSISAAVAAPQMRGPGILLLGVLAIITGLYAALAARELFDRGG